jgi:uncharacterized protein YuzE
MKKEYDFSAAQRGKFYRPDARLNLPVYLDKQVRQSVERLAKEKHSDISSVVNKLLKSDKRLAKTGHWRLMAGKVKIWYDPEGDFLEVLFSDEPGQMVETAEDAVMKRVDAKGRVLGFSVLGVSRLRKDHPLTAELIEPRVA